MSWFKDAVTSSVGRKITVALTALFLITFLVVHALGNVQLFFSADAFNEYSYFMSHNELIRIMEIVLFLAIILHIYGTLSLDASNSKSRPVKYKVSKASQNSTWFSRNMATSGIIIFIFLVVHFINFWGPYHFSDDLKTVVIEGKTYKDMYHLVTLVFQEYWWYSILYVFSMVLLAFHLNHGFQSAFQSLGINHKKYTPFIKSLGVAYSIFIPLLFASMPIYFIILKFVN